MAEPRKRREVNRLERSKTTRARLRLLASSKLSDAKVRHVIRCYAFGMTPAQAVERTGLSHVTIYRLYGHIRRRLAHFDILRSKGDFIAFITEGEAEGRPHFDWDEFDAFVRSSLGRHRGIRAINRDLYVAEAVARYEESFTPGQLYRLTILAIRAGGPLNRPPQRSSDWRVLAEIFRLTLLRARTIARSSDLGPGFSSLFGGPADEIQRNADQLFDAVAEHEAAIDRTERTVAASAPEKARRRTEH